jgi:cytochrome c biogenesis protein CcdA
MMAALAGRLITMDTWFRYAVALVPLLMGVHLLGLLRLPLPDAAPGATRRTIGSAFGAGLLLSLVIGPCSTPVFASALSFAAYKQNTIYGAVLLFVYGLGAGIPVLFAGATIGRAAQRLECGGLGAWVNRLVGASLLALGFYLLWNA